MRGRNRPNCAFLTTAARLRGPARHRLRTGLLAEPRRPPAERRARPRRPRLDPRRRPHARRPGRTRRLRRLRGTRLQPLDLRPADHPGRQSPDRPRLLPRRRRPRPRPTAGARRPGSPAPTSRRSKSPCREGMTRQPLPGRRARGLHRSRAGRETASSAPGEGCPRRLQDRHDRSRNPAAARTVAARAPSTSPSPTRTPPAR